MIEIFYDRCAKCGGPLLSGHRCGDISRSLAKIAVGVAKGAPPSLWDLVEKRAAEIVALRALRARVASLEKELAAVAEICGKQFAELDAIMPRLAAAEFYAAIGRIAMRFIDRAGDTCEEDTAETICAEFYAAILEEVNRQGSGGEGDRNG